MAIDKDSAFVWKKGGKLDTKNQILSDDFYMEMKVCCEVLQPAASTITLLEGEEPSAHKVVKLINDLCSNTKEAVEKLPISELDKIEMFKSISKRKRMSLKPVHYPAILLDPSNKGSTLNNTEFGIGLEFMEHLAKRIPEVDEIRACTEFTEFKNKTGILFSVQFIWFASDKCEPIAW